ncbi:MAG: serine acetyltransferase [Planctomycetes bacterium]|nr:serine acetyltransferase [Planctomycetota bacterium]
MKKSEASISRSGAPIPRPPSAAQGRLSALVAALCEANGGLHAGAEACPRRRPLPSRSDIIGMVEALRSILFPGHFGPSELTDENLAFHVGSTLDRVQRELCEQVKRGLCFSCEDTSAECEARALAITQQFLDRLPAVRRLLDRDIQAAFEGDPASTSTDEAIFCYPGVLAVMNYRLAHELHLLGVPLIPRIITEHAHSVTGIDIHPGAAIGESFFIDHGTGVVIGETCIIGNRVRLYQGVTLGAKSFPLDEQGRPIKGVPRHPIVEDDVIIYSEATILGRVTIGRGSVIGGNVWLTRSVPPESLITQAHVRREVFEAGGGI